MPTQRNDGRNANRQQQTWRGEQWGMGATELGRNESEQRWARSDRDWDRETWDRDRDDEYRSRAGAGREIDSGRFVQGERNMGHGSGGNRFAGGVGYGSATTHGRGMYGAGYGGEPSQMRDERMTGHRGKGPRNFVRSDERLCERVCEILTEDDRIDASDVDVKVRDGEVTLTGVVDDRRTKHLVEDVIEDLPGIKDIHNALRVRRGLFGHSATESAIDHLNSFLRGELSAVETYRIALDRLDKASNARGELESCKRSHEERVNMLRNEISRLGGTPATSSGPWGVFAKTIESGARVLGDKTAIAALEEGEDHGLKDYKDDIDKLDPVFRDLVRSRLLPAQEDTHTRMSTLKHRLS